MLIVLRYLWFMILLLLVLFFLMFSFNLSMKSLSHTECAPSLTLSLFLFHSLAIFLSLTCGLSIHTFNYRWIHAHQFLELKKKTENYTHTPYEIRFQWFAWFVVCRFSFTHTHIHFLYLRSFQTVNFTPCILYLLHMLHFAPQSYLIKSFACHSHSVNFLYAFVMCSFTNVSFDCICCMVWEESDSIRATRIVFFYEFGLYFF